MGAAGDQREELARLSLVRGLAENPAADGDDGVGGKDKGVGMPLVRGLGLRARQPRGGKPRRLVLKRGLIDVGRVDLVGLDPDLAEQSQAPGTGARQDEPASAGQSYLNR
jgi:hypothetical protein